MLAYDPNDRLSLVEIENHPWFIRQRLSLMSDKNIQKIVHQHLSRRLEYTTTLTRVSINKQKIGYVERTNAEGEGLHLG